MESTTARRIAIRLPKEIADLVPGYVDRRREDASAILAALDEGRLDAVRTLGHRMKGTGAGYGLGFVTQAGARIERAAEDRDRHAVRMWVLDLVVYLARIDVLVDTESAA